MQRIALWDTVPKRKKNGSLLYNTDVWRSSKYSMDADLHIIVQSIHTMYCIKSMISMAVNYSKRSFLFYFRLYELCPAEGAVKGFSQCAETAMWQDGQKISLFSHFTISHRNRNLAHQISAGGTDNLKPHLFGTQVVFNIWNLCLGYG